MPDNPLANDPLTQTLVERQLAGARVSSTPPPPPRPDPPSLANGLWSPPLSQPAGSPPSSPSGPPPSPSPSLPGGALPPTGPPLTPPVAPTPAGIFPSPVTGNPTTLPAAPTHVPPAYQRWSNAQHIERAYQDGGHPNPMLLRAMLARR